jgi:hypothetical protein
MPSVMSLVIEEVGDCDPEGVSAQLGLTTLV